MTTPMPNPSSLLAVAPGYMMIVITGTWPQDGVTRLGVLCVLFRRRKGGITHFSGHRAVSSVLNLTPHFGNGEETGQRRNGRYLNGKKHTTLLKLLCMEGSCNTSSSPEALVTPCSADRGREIEGCDRIWTSACFRGNELQVKYKVLRVFGKPSFIK